MKPYNVHYFSDDSAETEFVVISDQGEAAIKAEFEGDGVRLVESLPIEGDATSLPCDRKLFK